MIAWPSLVLARSENKAHVGRQRPPPHLTASTRHRTSPPAPATAPHRQRPQPHLTASTRHRTSPPAPATAPHRQRPPPHLTSTVSLRVPGDVFLSCRVRSGRVTGGERRGGAEARGSARQGFSRRRLACRGRSHRGRVRSQVKAPGMERTPPPAPALPTGNTEPAVPRIPPPVRHGSGFIFLAVHTDQAGCLTGSLFGLSRGNTELYANAAHLSLLLPGPQQKAGRACYVYGASPKQAVTATTGAAAAQRAVNTVAVSQGAMRHPSTPSLGKPLAAEWETPLFMVADGRAPGDGGAPGGSGGRSERE
ncbi:unnamed protein product [Boreogadus saida]